MVLHQIKHGFSSIINAVVIPSITSYQPLKEIDTKEWTIPQNIPVDLLIEALLFYDILLVGQIKGEKHRFFKKQNWAGLLQVHLYIIKTR